MAGVLKRQWMIDEMMRVEMMVAQEVKVKEKDQVMKVADLKVTAASSELRSMVVEVMRKVRKRCIRNVRYTMLIFESL